jgi:hypothetical protein
MSNDLIPVSGQQTTSETLRWALIAGVAAINVSVVCLGGVHAVWTVRARRA